MTETRSMDKFHLIPIRIKERHATIGYKGTAHKIVTEHLNGTRPVGLRTLLVPLNDI